MWWIQVGSCFASGFAHKKSVWSVAFESFHVKCLLWGGCGGCTQWRIFDMIVPKCEFYGSKSKQSLEATREEGIWQWK